MMDTTVRSQKLYLVVDELAELLAALPTGSRIPMTPEALEAITTLCASLRADGPEHESFRILLEASA